jgi:hypothetical protein
MTHPVQHPGLATAPGLGHHVMGFLLRDGHWSLA